MKEVVIYFFLISLIVIFIAWYLSKNRVFEGLENASDSSAKPTPSSVTNITGIGAPSQLYDQTITTAIAALDTELNLTTYSSQYLQIISNMRELYKKRALKELLQTPPNSDYSRSVGILATYDQSLKMIDTLEDYVRATSKTTKTGLWS